MVEVQEHVYLFLFSIAACKNCFRKVDLFARLIRGNFNATLQIIMFLLDGHIVNLF